MATERRKSDIKETIKSKIESNADKIYVFVRWYVDTPPKERTKINWEKVSGSAGAIEFDFVMTNWLFREDVQNAIKEYIKTKRTLKMLEIYESMYDKAITKGDVNAAKWCNEFFKSDFFESGTDEIEEYLKGINIPALGDK